MGEKIQLLVVDDEKDFVTYLAKRLESHDFDVHAFTDPLEALEQTKGQRYDVGILDLKMPGMDGEELLNKLKERDARMELIILTGHGSIESAFRTAQRGAYEYLRKPCDFDSLVTSINNAYAKRIKALSGHKAAEVDKLMKQAGEMKPLDLLKRLKKIHDGLQGYLTAAALAEGGDLEGAKDLLREKDKDTHTE
jgi:DNA-binding NtrC family response regulator